MGSRKTEAVAVHPVIISLGTVSIAFALAVPWLPWWELLWPLALASFVFTSGALTFLTVSRPVLTNKTMASLTEIGYIDTPHATGQAPPPAPRTLEAPAG
jgi:hypothetical protein